MAVDDYPSAVYGWRVFTLRDDSLIPPFIAWTVGQVMDWDIWQPGPNFARCVSGDREHVVPDDDCECGFRVVEKLEELLRMARSMATKSFSQVNVLDECGVIGRVKLWGRIRPGVDGDQFDVPTTWRGNQARLLELHLAPEHVGVADALYDRYGVPIRTYSAKAWPGKIEPIPDPRQVKDPARFLAAVHDAGFGLFDMNHPDADKILLSCAEALIRPLRQGATITDLAFGAFRMQGSTDAESGAGNDPHRSPLPRSRPSSGRRLPDVGIATEPAASGCAGHGLLPNRPRPVIGWAGTEAALTRRMSYLPAVDPPPGWEDEPACAVCDWWEPPHPMALPTDLCERIIAQIGDRESCADVNGTYFIDTVTPDDEQVVLDRVKAANRLWWQLDIHRWDVKVKRYGRGEQHPEHTDWHPAGGGCRKIVAGVQLSAGDEYRGGDFRFRWWDNDLELPRTRGTLTVFPAWVYHQVTPVTAGQRWSLVVNGWGPPLR